MPKLTPVDSTFLDGSPKTGAPKTVVVKQHIAAPIQRVWDVIADNDTWTEWFPAMTECTTTSDPATGVGATRRVIVGALEADEIFVTWDEPHQWAFIITRTNIPMATKFLEQLELAEDSTGTMVTYTGAFTPHLVTKLSYPLVKRGIKKSWTEGLQGLAAHVE